MASGDRITPSRKAIRRIALIAAYVALLAALLTGASTASAASGRAVFENPTHDRAMPRARARRLTRRILRTQYSIPHASILICRRSSLRSSNCGFGGNAKDRAYYCGTTRVRATAKHLVVHIWIFTGLKCES
jgi:hypothetical protein